MPRDFPLLTIGLASEAALHGSPDVDAHARPRGCGRSPFSSLPLGPGAFRNFLPGRALETPLGHSLIPQQCLRGI
jgi:hypothetical protein